MRTQNGTRAGFQNLLLQGMMLRFLVETNRSTMSVPGTSVVSDLVASVKQVIQDECEYFH